MRYFKKNVSVMFASRIIVAPYFLCVSELIYRFSFLDRSFNLTDEERGIFKAWIYGRKENCYLELSFIVLCIFRKDINAFTIINVTIGEKTNKIWWKEQKNYYPVFIKQRNSINFESFRHIKSNALRLPRYS